MVTISLDKGTATVTSEGNTYEFGSLKGSKGGFLSLQFTENV